jgi:glucose uptake protein
MFVPMTFAVALIMTILSTICWGSFANTFKLTKSYRFELYYWDYAIGIFLVSVVLAFTMGSTSGAPSSFLNNVHSASAANLAYAMIGGFIFNIANVLLVAGIDIVGLSVAFPISIGIALVEGVALSYAIQPKGNRTLLVAGVAMALLAVILVGKSYSQLQAQGTKVPRKGVLVCIVSGLLMGMFAPFVTRAMTSEAVLTPYTTAVFFTLASFLCCFVFNTVLMKKPLVGEPVNFSAYFSAPAGYHALGLLGGVVWGFGLVFNLVAASFVGVAISYAIGQASPMIAAAWGVFVFHEFRNASGRAKVLLAGMFACYVAALTLIAMAYGQQ